MANTGTENSGGSQFFINLADNSFLDWFDKVGLRTRTARMQFFAHMHCIALHCIALHCTALHCSAVQCIALYCIALH